MGTCFRSTAWMAPALAAAFALAGAYEAPPTFKAAELLPAALLRGPHHTVAPLVKTEGYLHAFEVTTDYGPLDAEGLTMLRVRLQEVGALAELDKVSKSEVFVKAAGNSVLAVGKGVASAVKDPEATAKGMGQGVKRLGTNLGRKAKRTTDKAVDSATNDDEDAGSQAAEAGTGIAHSMLGVNASARKWAQKVGVDPYTTNKVLKKALTDLGQIDAAGSLAAKIAVPIPPVVSGTAAAGKLVWGQDPEALLKGNEQKLRDLGVANDTIQKLYLSKGFSLSLHTRLAASLGEVKVPGCADYVATAAESDAEREAVFFVESAEMLARFHRTASVAAVLSDSRALVAKTADGRAVVLLPVDWVRWSRAYDEALAEIGRRARGELQASRLELRSTGKLSALAKQETSARGWQVVENVR